MIGYLGRRYRLSASHRLHTQSLSDEENRAAFGKCNNPHGHGHNYSVEVVFAGPIDAVTGMVIDLAALDAFTRAEVLDRFDHTNLNLAACFADLVPTTENFSVALHRIFAGYQDAHFSGARLQSVHVEETSNNSFDYAGGGPVSFGRM